MANMLTNKPPILSQIEPLSQLREMQGLSLILGRVKDSNTIQNTSESINDFKNSMVYAQNLTWGNFNRVAAVQSGNKYVSSDDRPTAYRPDGTSTVSQQSGKSYALDGSGYLHLILGNSNLNWREDLYDGMNFAKGLPTFKGNGIHTTPSGWVYATVGKMFDGVNDESGTNWFPVTNYMDYWKEFKELNTKNEKAQAKRICGSGNEQNTGTCCLYFKNNYYDNVAGITWNAGDYYKCTCAKCYQCLHMAKSLDMDYIFTKFDGVGPTGGTGPRCQSCDLDNHPSDCGPCPCTIGTYDKFDVILNDKFLPEKGLVKSNAKIAKDWKHNLKGSVIVHCNLDMVDYTKREINRSYWGKEKILEFDGPQVDTKTKTIYRLATEVIQNKEYIIGITLVSTGSYTAMPTFPKNKLVDMVPGIDASYFRTVMLPDFSELSEVSELVGGTRIQINKTVKISDIVNKTNVSNFNAYGIGLLKTKKDELYFTKTNNLSTSSRLTYRHEGVKEISGLIYASLSEAIAAEKKKSNVQVKNTTSSNNIIISNSKATDTSTTDLEVYAGNTTEFTEDFEYVDGEGRTWQASNGGWLKPTSATTGEELDAQKTDVLHVNGFSMSIPKADEGIHSIPGLINHTIKITLTL